MPGAPIVPRRREQRPAPPMREVRRLLARYRRLAAPTPRRTARGKPGTA